MAKIVLFFLGIGLCSTGFLFLILYLNLFTMGYSFFEYVQFISSRFECYFVLIGSICIVISLEGSKMHEKILRHRRKF